MKQDMMGSSRISRTTSKSFAPHTRQTTTPAHHLSFFTGRMLYLMSHVKALI